MKLFETSEDKGRVILLDWGIFTHRAIFAYARDLKTHDGKSFLSPSSRSCLSSIISTLCKIGVNHNDTLILAQDSREGSWRKQFKNEYKKDRAEKREQTAQETGLNWGEEWKKMDFLADKIHLHTPIHVINVPHMEADDIIAVACKYYTNREIICVSYDSDLEQLWYYPNFKIYSVLKKDYPYKIKPANFDTFKKIAKEIRSNTHNNLSSEVLDARDYEIKKLIIDLINLPDEIVIPIIEAFKNIKDKKDVNPNLLPYPSIRDRWDNIYKKNKVITYEKCVKKLIGTGKKK